MSRVVGWSVVAVTTISTFAGCMMPAYRAPAGFSSTYFRHLYSQDPRVLPHRLPEDFDDSAIRIQPENEDAPVLVPKPLDGVVTPESQLPQSEKPALPIDPKNQPTPPEPLPDAANSLNRKPIDSSADSQAKEPMPAPRSLPNAAMSVRG